MNDNDGTMHEPGSYHKTRENEQKGTNNKIKDKSNQTTILRSIVLAWNPIGPQTQSRAKQYSQRIIPVLP